MSQSLESGLVGEATTKDELNEILKNRPHDKIIDWLENKNLGKLKYIYFIFVYV